MAISVGIDLGTTFSAVAYIDKLSNQPKVIPNSEGKKITPSIIQFLDDEVIFGSEAEDAFAAGESGCVATFKRSMGKQEAYCYINGKAYTAIDLSAILLKHLKEEAEAELGEAIQDAVITVPAYFYSIEREATIQAASKAGIKVKKIIDEPNAAVMAYGLNHWRENANILVYDLGGGTFDVTLSHMNKNCELQTIVTRGDHYLGGRDWDSRIGDLLINKFEEETGLDFSEKDYIMIVRGMAETVKKQLTSMNSVVVKASFPNYGRAAVTISRTEFEENTADLLERTGVFCRAVLDEAKMRWSDITDILLVGGSTRMPQVTTYLTRLSGKKPIAHVNPDEAVALGAAIQASKSNDTYVHLSVTKKDGKKVTERKESLRGVGLAVRPAKKIENIGSISLRENTAHAMGIVAINDEEDRYYNEIIIPANHPRPVRAAKRFRFYTSPSSQNELVIYVLQGDDVDPANCQIPHKYIVTGIRHIPRGERFGTVIRVQYSYDTNGIIHIQARQEDDETDLPIQMATVSFDKYVFSRPISANKDTASSSALGLMIGGGSGGGIVHKYKAVNFSNAEWEKYDNITMHPSGAQFNEPTIHIIANEENIEFHGYNVSAMDEGVKYTFDASEYFEIECDIDTSTIQPHPGGYVKISLGMISANLGQFGGAILLGDSVVANVGAKFNLVMIYSQGGNYRVQIDGKLVGEAQKETSGYLDVVFGFVHDAHCCEILSHAYISNIMMRQGTAQDSEDESAETPTWDD